MNDTPKTGEPDSVYDVEIELIEVEPEPQRRDAPESPEAILTRESVKHGNGGVWTGGAKKKGRFTGKRTPTAGVVRLVAYSIPFFMVVGLSYWALVGINSSLLGVANRLEAEQKQQQTAPAQPSAANPEAVLPQMRMANTAFPDGFSAIDVKQFAADFPMAFQAARQDGGRIANAAIPDDETKKGMFLYTAMGGSLDLHSLGVDSFNGLKEKILANRELAASGPDDRIMAPFNDTGDSVCFGRIVKQDGKTMTEFNCLMQYRDAAIMLAAGHVYDPEQAIDAPLRDGECEAALLSWRDMLWNEQ